MNNMLSLIKQMDMGTKIIKIKIINRNTIKTQIIINTVKKENIRQLIKTNTKMGIIITTHQKSYLPTRKSITQVTYFLNYIYLHQGDENISDNNIEEFVGINQPKIMNMNKYNKQKKFL